MHRLIAVLAVLGIGIAGFAGSCNLLNPSINQIGSNDVYGAELQNNTGTNFLAHSFRVAFVNGNGSVVDTKVAVPGCLRSWQSGASDFFSVRSTQLPSTTLTALGGIDLGQPLVVGNLGRRQQRALGCSGNPQRDGTVVERDVDQQGLGDAERSSGVRRRVQQHGRCGCDAEDLAG